MKKSHEKLEGAIKYLKSTYSDLSQHVLDVLEESKKELEKHNKKKRCKHCDRYNHYDETSGVWNCEQCDKKPKPCPICTAETTYVEELGIWKCNECDWNG